MDNNVIILKDIVKMSDAEDQDVKTEEEKKDFSPIEKTEDNLNLIQPDDKSDKKINTDHIKVTEEDFEQALEKVIKKLFADKIDAILERVIEDIVSKEIKILKQSLTE
ncbi:MAG: hypothetical protein JRJ44_04535 [Deltaproteobacteria bacterium]|nr:hypothetical protein [Deltaproteobacteria bacterium]